MVTVHFVAHPSANGADTTTVSVPAGKSLMQAAQSGGVDGVAADCGGSLTCATCHVLVREPWVGQLPPPGAEEKGMLDFTAAPAQPNSRLACQITLTDALNGLVVDLPLNQY
ncbi:MAG: ferredoxin [Polaromonas sp.]|nr:ferredoxin [Polaromonas sp.]